MLGRMRGDAGLTTKWDSIPCEDPQSLDDVSGDKNSDGFTPGNCAVHVTHWRPLGDGTKHGNNNQLDKHQLGIMIKDGTNKQMMFAPKQPVMGTLSAHTSLGPLNVTVDDDTIHFFHGNQHWTEDSKDHQCSFPKAKWDGDTETKSGSCIYHCESPPESVPDDLDSKDLQVTPIQKAYDGNGGNPNMHFADDYRKGWCTFHLRVYQRNEDNEDLNPSSFYAMEIALYDAGDDDNDAKIIAYQSQTFAEKSVNIQGPLPYELIATPPKDDDDHVYFKYAGASFHTGDKKNCGNCGAYDSGAMDCDCGFTC
ncbi:hypothetical protein NUU61_007685 [Penicillium alfredii]|uniref:Uncharacterized protein n=1 Tax=Penicillium alfredii TaxID=1506179 RepID=A0A9W9EQX8_9EURO|nr:uncharacterized protein NUU61_007685 [Penicillium alfredii]KAJ5086378.1 hypothetical protein NUU61_007685 [Penicillium alfredii]